MNVSLKNLLRVKELEVEFLQNEIFQAEITSIPALLIKYRGNKTEVTRILGCSRGTVMKHANDVMLNNHVVVNGRVMVRHSAKSEGSQ